MNYYQLHKKWNLLIEQTEHMSPIAKELANVLKHSKSDSGKISAHLLKQPNLIMFLGGHALCYENRSSDIFFIADDGSFITEDYEEYEPKSRVYMAESGREVKMWDVPIEMQQMLADFEVRTIRDINIHNLYLTNSDAYYCHMREEGKIIKSVYWNADRNEFQELSEEVIEDMNRREGYF